MKNSQKRFIVSLLVILVILIGAGVYFYQKSGKTNIQQTACTQEAMQCPDGSYVGRTGPQCSFAPCPTPTNETLSSGILQGTITIGPICPVERVDHPCNPTPEMYAAHKIFVYTPDRSTTITTLTPDSTGHFTVSLPAGDYLVDVEHSAVGAVRGVPSSVKIISKKTYTLNISIDTGIR